MLHCKAWMKVWLPTLATGMSHALRILRAKAKGFKIQEAHGVRRLLQTLCNSERQSVKTRNAHSASADTSKMNIGHLHIRLLAVSRFHKVALLQRNPHSTSGREQSHVRESSTGWDSAHATKACFCTQRRLTFCLWPEHACTFNDGIAAPLPS